MAKSNDLAIFHFQRRAERFDSSRQLDFFADLNLGPSDDEGDEPTEPVREGVGQFVSMLSPAQSSTFASATNTLENITELSTLPDDPSNGGLPTAFGAPKKKGKGKRKAKTRSGTSHGQSSKPNSKWADKCMYAELLEMTEDLEMTEFGSSDSDGIPSDIETGWVAVAPVPAGKRCLAITHAPSGITGLGKPDYALRSRNSENIEPSSAQYHVTFSRTWQIANETFSIVSPTSYRSRLHPRRELAYDWCPPYSGRNQMEGPRYR